MQRHAVRISKLGYAALLMLAILVAGSSLTTSFGTNPKNIAWPPLPASTLTLAGAESCKPCHQAIYDSFLSTAHNLTSRPAESQYLKGSFEEGKNKFVYNPFMEVVMERDDSGFYQTSVAAGSVLESQRIDIVVGSGRKGQTYLYWKGNQMFQLPVSYFTPTNSWCNSPGYSTIVPSFNRIIAARCIECHGSNAKMEDKGLEPNRYAKNSIVYGIDCERCHGPAKMHVDFHTANTGYKEPMYINSKQMLSREQNLDLCALCHAGLRKSVTPPFTFTAGDKLTDFSLPTYNEDSTSVLDVHGNQYGLTTSSACFKKSGVMTCASCHNVHQEEYNKPGLFSGRCMTCHGSKEENQIQCKLAPVSGLKLSDNCIDCHMPMLPSKNIFLQTADRSKSSADFVRTHRVAIYPDATKAFLSKFKNSPKAQ